MSQKRRDEKEARDEVREITLRRAGYRCQARLLDTGVRCWHPPGEDLDVHEIVRRSQYPGGHLDVENTLALCRAHHDWCDDHSPEAEAVGLVKRGWSRDRDRS